jgi:hypothetical protein
LKIIQRLPAGFFTQVWNTSCNLPYATKKSSAINISFFLSGEKYFAEKIRISRKLASMKAHRPQTVIILKEELKISSSAENTNS